MFTVKLNSALLCFSSKDNVTGCTATVIPAGAFTTAVYTDLVTATFFNTLLNVKLAVPGPQYHTQVLDPWPYWDLYALHRNQEEFQQLRLICPRSYHKHYQEHQLLSSLLNGWQLNSTHGLLGTHAPKISTPGANISGFRIHGDRREGPRDENLATCGDGLVPNIVIWNLILTVALSALIMYFFTNSPLFRFTVTKGMSKSSGNIFCLESALMIAPAALSNAQKIYLPATALGSVELPSQISLDLFPYPKYIGSLETNRFSGYTDFPRTDSSSLPRVTRAANSLSTVPAPTVVIQGAPFSMEYGRGPEFPAEQATKIPFFNAAKAPMAIGFSSNVVSGKPRDNDMTSTPSAMA
ncbi:hypothetical protein CUMW_160400 [Citrus unshiu]|nr:hypothetical protein CUMW_160400 [Citrus unshiu]